MLSRTASELYWLSRYLERAENTARMLDVAWNLSLIPKMVVSPKEELLAPMKITGCVEDFNKQYETDSIDNMLHFMTLDNNNVSSISHCLNQARDKAKAVRGKITNEMWEAINGVWIELQHWQSLPMTSERIVEFIDWVKNGSNLFRGTTYGTLIRGDAYCFLRLGIFLERADNTARILVVKHQGKDHQTGEIEHYRLSALLRSVSAWETYRELYRDRLDEGDVAELLILHDRFPRSLYCCMQEILNLLIEIEGDQGLRSKRFASVQVARIRYGDIDHILNVGVHAYIDDFIKRVNELSESITQEYLELI